MTKNDFRMVCMFGMLFLLPASAWAGWQDIVNQWLGNESASEPAAASSPAAKTPSRTQMNKAILEALSVGVERAIALLGREGGYFKDAQVRIPMPRDLEKIEGLLRKLGQDKYADRFIQSMNTAAEQAVPQTSRIFLDAIKNMSVRDAQKILQGSDDAATQYFRQHTSANLQTVIRPIVSTTMNNVGVTKHYKKLVSKADFLGNYVEPETLDVDAYVTRLTIEGLFIKLADEERKIRNDPTARSTELLKQVFEYF